MAPLKAAALVALAALASALPVPQRGVGGRVPNVARLERLRDLGLISSGPVAINPNDPWNTSAIRGVNYVPSTSHNSIETFLRYDGAAVRRELGFAKAAAPVNTIRVTLHWAAWANSSSTFFAALDDMVAAASALQLRVIFAVFDGEGACCQATPAWVASGAFIGAPWQQNPGTAIIADQSQWGQLEAYVDALTSRYGSNPAVIGWDVIYNPPSGGAGGAAGMMLFTGTFGSRIRAAVPKGNAFVTMSIIPGGEVCDSAHFNVTFADAISFLNYNGNTGAISGDTLGVQGCSQSLAGSGNAPFPVILSGTMSRQTVPPQTLCDALFEASGQGWIDVPTHPPVGIIVTSLMIGVDGTSGGSPPDRGLVWPNGTWYSQAELGCMQAVKPGPPPPPPGPPPPVVNFTVGGLTVGLRPGTHTIQNLGLVGDNTWYRNFSWVPPLWNFLPPLPHRDFSGCHHIGDLMLRVQPEGESNNASWAFYTSAQADGTTHVTPINSTGAGTFDAADITPAFNTGGQPDTRYPLGLQVRRYFELAPGLSAAADGALRMRFSLTNTNSSGVRIGSLGIALLSGHQFGGLTPEDIAAGGSFLEGYPGGPRGWASMARADGSRTLLVTPCPSAGPGAVADLTGMEAWRPVLEDGSPTDSGVFSWEVYSAAFAPEWAVNKQAPAYMEFPQGPLYEAAWPNPLSPTPSWHLAETLYKPNPRQWNPPSSIVLQPGETRDFAVCLSLAPTANQTEALQAPALRDAVANGLGLSSVAAKPVADGAPRSRDAGLAAAGQPALLSVPGYVLGTDMQSAVLVVLPPSNASVKGVSSDDPTVLTSGAVSSSGPYIVVPLQPLSRGRARLLVTYSDGTYSAVHYYVLAPLRSLIDSYGSFAAGTAWLPRGFKDPFGRSASVMPWDREDGEHILQDGRPFVVGLSDDAGAGANLGLAAKVANVPTIVQAARLDLFVNATLMGVKPDTATPPLFSLQDPANDRILMTLFYFYNPALNNTNYYTETDKCQLYPSWCSFNSPYPGYNPAKWINEYREFNFPHIVSVYYALYRIARDYAPLAAAAGLRQSWAWYLQRAAQTLFSLSCYDAQRQEFTCIPTTGLMDETIFREILIALLEEAQAGAAPPPMGTNSWQAYATGLNYTMSARVFGFNGQVGWVDQVLNAGSEFSWDTTGQEGVAVWGAYFHAVGPYGDLNTNTVGTILAFMPSMPNWAYHGSAYGFGDFSNNAKWMATGGGEREGGHYRAGLNSIPLVERFRRSNPDDLYTLSVGLGGVTGVLPNIDEDGAPSMAFHTHPFILDHDPNSGDHGLGFFGHSMNTGAHAVLHPVLGWLCFLCDAHSSGSGSTAVQTIAPRDSFRERVYLEPLGLLLWARTGRIANVTLQPALVPGQAPSSGTITVDFEPANSDVQQMNTELAAPGLPDTEGLKPLSGRPFQLLRLQVEGASAAAGRPFAFTWQSPAGATLDRGAYSFQPPANDGTAAQVTITYTRNAA